MNGLFKRFLMCALAGAFAPPFWDSYPARARLERIRNSIIQFSSARCVWEHVLFPDAGRGESGRRLVSILAPDQLFRDDVMARLAKTGNTRAAEMNAGDDTGAAEA